MLLHAPCDTPARDNVHDNGCLRGKSRVPHTAHSFELESLGGGGDTGIIRTRFSVYNHQGLGAVGVPGLKWLGLELCIGGSGLWFRIGPSEPATGTARAVVGSQTPETWPKKWVFWLFTFALELTEMMHVNRGRSLVHPQRPALPRGVRSAGARGGQGYRGSWGGVRNGETGVCLSLGHGVFTQVVSGHFQSLWTHLAYTNLQNGGFRTPKESTNSSCTSDHSPFWDAQPGGTRCFGAVVQSTGGRTRPWESLIWTLGKKTAEHMGWPELSLPSARSAARKKVTILTGN